MTAVETPEQATRSRERIEDFARRAHDVRCAVECLEKAFLELADYPEDLGGAMARLRALADVTGSIAHDWATQDNCDFDPSAPRQQG